MWKIEEHKEHGHIVRQTEDVKCVFCGTKMILHSFSVDRYPVKGFYHCDITMKCPKCGWVSWFGLVLSKEDYEKLKESPLNGIVLTDELLDMEGLSEEDEEAIKKRLSSLGYYGGEIGGR